jgi:hypothetical protein
MKFLAMLQTEEVDYLQLTQLALHAFISGLKGSNTP